MINNAALDNNSQISSLRIGGQKADSTVSWLPDSVIKAVVTERTKDKASLVTEDNFLFEVAASAVKGQVGDELSFRVIGSGKDGVTLKQIAPVEGAGSAGRVSSRAGEAAEQKKTFNIKELLKQNDIVQEEKVLNPEEDEQRKADQAVARIKRQINYASDNASESAVRELIKGGLSLQKISLDVLTSVMREIEKQPVKELSPEELARLTREASSINDASKSKASVTKKGSGRTALSGQDMEAVIQALHNNDLPINERNIHSLENVLFKADVVRESDDAAIMAMLRSEKLPTLENTYIYKHSVREPDGGSSRNGFKTRVEPLDDSGWNELMPQVEKLFTREGIEINDDNYRAARFLFENELPITKENVDTINVIKGFAASYDRNELLDLAAANIRAGKNPSDISLAEMHGGDVPGAVSGAAGRDIAERMENYGAIIKDIPSIKTETIELLLKRHIPLSLRNLLTAEATPPERLEMMGHGTGHREQLSDQNQARDETPLELLTARRQLAEIRQRLTHEAAYRLAGKAIDIDVMPLREAVETLRDLEKESYARSLRIFGKADRVAQDTGESENVERMSDLYQRLSQIRPLPYSVMGDILRKDIDFTISNVHSRAMTARTMEDYETFATAPSAKYGDSFSMVRDQFSALLESMGIEPTEENTRAAVILSRNNMDVDMENMLGVKLTDAKLNAIMNRLHPHVASTMLKEGLNPVDMHVDEVLEYIDRFNDMFGDGLRDKIAGYIMNMDSGKSPWQVQPHEREGIIAVYRMLNQLQKNDGAAIGAALKAGTSPTLGNLLEASKYYGKTHARHAKMDVKIDDSFGAAENIARSYIRELLHTLTDSGNPAALRSLSDDIYDKPLESLIKAVQAEPAPELDTERTAEQLRELLEASPATIHFMEKNQIPATAGNIVIMQQMANDPFFLGRCIGLMRSDARAGDAPRSVRDITANKPEIGANLREYAANESENVEYGEADELAGELMDSELVQLREGKTPDELLQAIESKAEALEEDALSDEDVSGRLLARLNLIRNAVRLQGEANKSAGEGYSLPIKLRGGITNLNMYVLNEKMADSGKVLVSLETGSLGAVQAYFSLDGGELSVQFTCDNPKGLSYLRENSGILSGFLEEAGVRLGDIEYTQQESRNVLKETIEQPTGHVGARRIREREEVTGKASFGMKTRHVEQERSETRDFQIHEGAYEVTI